jgi:hypothetical protein
VVANDLSVMEAFADFNPGESYKALIGHEYWATFVNKVVSEPPSLAVSPRLE